MSADALWKFIQRCWVVKCVIQGSYPALILRSQGGTCCSFANRLPPKRRRADGLLTFQISNLRTNRGIRSTILENIICNSVSYHKKSCPAFTMVNPGIIFMRKTPEENSQIHLICSDSVWGFLSFTPTLSGLQSFIEIVNWVKSSVEFIIIETEKCW